MILHQWDKLVKEKSEKW